MTLLKLQLEIRYKPILDFHERIRTIMAPHLKVAAYGINNAGTFDENAMLQYKDEGYAIDIRHDRIVFIGENKTENIYSENGQLYHYLKLFDAISKLETFVVVTNTIFAVVNLFESKKSKIDIVNSFRKTNIQTNIPDFEKPFKDLAIHLTYNEPDSNFRVQYGPFVPETDILNYGLNIFNSKERESLKEKSGILSQCILIEKCSEFDIDLFRRMDKKVNHYVKELKEKVCQE